MPYLKYHPDREKYPWGSCWFSIPEVMYVYKSSELKKWSDRELLIMHYYLTQRLDGYGHLDADKSISTNCDTFRNELHSRNIDAVQNVIDNETYYNWGYREIITTWVPLEEN